MDRKTTRKHVALVVLAAFALLGVRCAHTPKTPEQRACKARVDHCMERCQAEPTAHDPNDTRTGGCDGDIRSQCEKDCYELCDW